MNHPAVEPLGEAKSHGEVLRLLARGMGLPHPALHESDEEIAASALPDGMDLCTLKAAGWIKRSPDRPVPGAAAKLRLCGGVPLPASPPSPGLLQLLTPKGHFFLNTTFADMARQRRSMGPPTLEMGRGDTEARGLADRQAVEVCNSQGSLHVQLAVSDALHHGVVALSGKWWGADIGGSANVNDITAPA